MTVFILSKVRSIWPSC